jgi:hypothetical protein
LVSFVSVFRDAKILDIIQKIRKMNQGAKLVVNVVG